jgi:4-hydroxybutyrate dehydrogenase / sulfolactaldehyde 3-reductase
MNIGFIGLGTMGGPMAANVLRRGFKVFGYDVDGSACKKLEAVGMATCASPAEAARQAEIVVTMLPTEVEVEAACLGPGGVVEGARPGLLLVEMSTIDPDASRSIAGRLRERGIDMIDAPVARGSKEAELGKLLIFVGGTEQQLERARALLECMGEIILHIGPQGQALVAKLVNNLLGLGTLAVVAEAFAIGRQGGVSLETMIKVATSTAATNGYVASVLQKKVWRGDTSPGFKIDLAHKDIGLALNWANRARLPVPMAALIRERYSQARAQGWGGEDCTAIVNLVKDLGRLA